MRRNAILWCLALSPASGALLALSDHPLHLAWLQAVAFVPWLAYLARPCRGLGFAALSGAILGAAYLVPILWQLEFGWLAGAAFFGYGLALWALLSALLFWTRNVHPLLWALSCGGAAVLVEWLNRALVPVWGTAQHFVRVWSALPGAVQFVALTGMLGVVFVLLSTQALAVNLLLRRGRPALQAAALGILLAAVASYDLAAWTSPAAGRIRVAVMGWDDTPKTRPDRRDALKVLRERIVPFASRAAADGAALAVAPETSVFADEPRKAAFIGGLDLLAGSTGIAVAVGLFDRSHNDNRLLWALPSGERVAEYRKTHLIPAIENTTPGDGRPVVLRLGEVRVGGMICQDDNFTDLARALGRDGVQLVAVPTNDWHAVKRFHLDNAIFRAIECRYAIARAASNGISAIVDSRGRVAGRMDPEFEGAGLLVAGLALFPGGSLYSRLGDLPLLIIAAAALAGALWRRRRPAAG
jgi:apolipoprotein N-acyltransferase